VLGGLLLHVAVAPASAQAPPEVTLAAVHGADTLAVTVILPDGRGPFPAVVLVHGSDSATRETGPYRLHAEFLARHGVAAVIYDKRGAGRSTGVYRESEDFTLLADDALAVHAAARALPAIDAARVGMWGRSQGGWVVPLAASRRPGVAFAILEVGGGVTVREQNIYARQQQLRARGLDASAVTEATEVWAAIWDYMGTAHGGGRADSLVRHARTRGWFSEAAPTMAGLSRDGTLPDSGWLAKNLTSPQLAWFRSHPFDPIPFVQRLDAPVLGVFAGDDAATPTPRSVERLTRALGRPGAPPSRLVVFPGANHGMCMPEPAGRRCRWPDGYQPLIAQWILDATR
jgi:alpha-beta hydrolase superfamily lysophospholipase